MPAKPNVVDYVLSCVDSLKRLVAKGVKEAVFTNTEFLPSQLSLAARNHERLVQELQDAMINATFNQMGNLTMTHLIFSGGPFAQAADHEAQARERLLLRTICRSIKELNESSMGVAVSCALPVMVYKRHMVDRFEPDTNLVNGLLRGLLPAHAMASIDFHNRRLVLFPSLTN